VTRPGADAESSWREAWRSLGIAEPPGLLSSLIARYNEPHRAYHNILHIQECFDALAPAVHLAERLAEVKLAIWFHDAIYDPRASDNEQASADLARESVLDGGGGRDEAHRIQELILATRHDRPVELKDARLLSDADLSILASPPERFDEYQMQIREEYSWMPREEFQFQRTRILKGFLERQAIYQTEWFASRLEEAARRNITRELATSPR